ncbi:MAG: D-2-hydroxyacid dehydrogenase [Sulfurospirillum sp.]|nr:MAG: D-2-hydroxyacid dehydrogenase [Sulfurospirillum sp.]
MKIAILDKDTLGNDISLKCIEAFGEVTAYPFTRPEERLARVQNSDIVITNKVVIDKEIMQNSDIKLICVAATGMNNIDLDYAKERSIPVKNVAGYSTPSVVQTTFAMALYLMQHLRHFDDYTKSDSGWTQSPVFTSLIPAYNDLADKNWGIIGLGEIGKSVAKVAEAFGSNILYYSTSGRNRDPDYQRTTLDDLLSSCDIVSIHAPLNPQTQNLINKNNLPLMKNDAVLLNLGRGGIINEEDLAAYIDRSTIRAGLDVLEHEPITADNPLLHIKAKERLLMTPHIAWASKESRERLVAGICKNIETFLGETS